MTDRSNEEASAAPNGGAIEPAAVEALLERHAPEIPGPFTIERFRAGHSNLTYLVRGRTGAVVLRRPPAGWERIAAGHDMRREYRVLSAIERRFARAPRPLFYCEAVESPLGVPCFGMEFVPGLVVRGADDVASATGARDMAIEFVEALVELHELDPRLEPVASLGRPAGYLRRQVEGWTSRYARARTDDVAAMERVAAWLHDKVPADASASLVHNDYKYDNLVVDPERGRIRALLDWEMATLGDPLADLGTSLAYWLEPDDAPELRELGLTATLAPGTPSRREVADLYAERSGRDTAGIHFHYTLGLFKVAVIAQQIYARYRAGLTRDGRFATLDGAVRALATAADRAVRGGKISAGE